VKAFAMSGIRQRNPGASAERVQHILHLQGLNQNKGVDKLLAPCHQWGDETSEHPADLLII
jgi:hypothetical protein